MDIKEFLPFYIGRNVTVPDTMPDGIYKLAGFITKNTGIEEVCRLQLYNETREQIYWLDYDVCKIHLRPLSSMIEVEMREVYRLMNEPGNAFHLPVIKIEFGEQINGFDPNIINVKFEGHTGSGGYSIGNHTIYLNQTNSYSFQYLLSKGFDLFRLIHAKLALDSTLVSSPHKA